MIAHFYHALDNPKGRWIYAEHVALMSEAGFEPDLFDVTWVTPGEGFEDLTLNKARDWAKANPTGRVLYSHTKGAFHHSGQHLWRRVVEARLIGEWTLRLPELNEADVVCLHWLTPANSSSSHGILITKQFAAGTFFWARSEYLARLPELPVLTMETRHMAEAWIGHGDPPPVVKDLSPGFPSYPCY
jgi:hypothetical protein